MRWKQWCIPEDQAGFLRTYTPRGTPWRNAVSYWGPSTGNDNRMDMPWGWSQSSPKWTVEVSNNRGRGWWIIGGSWHRFFGDSEKGPEQRWTKVCFAPCKGIQDSVGFWIPRRGFRIPGTGFQSLSVEVGFWISIVSGIPDALSCISNSKAPENSGFRKHNFLGFRIQDSPTWGEIVYV